MDSTQVMDTQTFLVKTTEPKDRTTKKTLQWRGRDGKDGRKTGDDRKRNLNVLQICMKWSNHFNQLKVVDFEKNGFEFQQRHPNYSLNIVLRGLKKDQWKTESSIN